MRKLLRSISKRFTVNSFPTFYDEVNTQKVCISSNRKFKPQPTGITIHYAADININRVIHSLKEKNLGYHVIIDRKGDVHQICSFHQSLYHAGKAMWRDKSPNRHHLAVCILSWGWLKQEASGQFQAWSKVRVPSCDVVYRKDVWWHKATDSQLASLKNFCAWATAHNINSEDICGHDECCIPKGRKLDPGGTLPDDFLEQLRLFSGRNETVPII